MSLASPIAVNIAGPTLTRAANATPYSANDSISDNATPGSVTPLVATLSQDNDAPVTVTAIDLDTTDTGLAAGVQVDVLVFNADPTANSGVGGGDNLAYSQKRAGFVGRFRGTFTAFSDGGRATCVAVDGANNVLQGGHIVSPAAGGTQVWLQYKAIGGFTPSGSSTTIAARLRGYQGRP